MTENTKERPPAVEPFAPLRIALAGPHELDPREETVVRMRFGLCADGILHDRDTIGCRFGVTMERIRQIERSGLAKLGLPTLQSPAPTGRPGKTAKTR